MTLPADFTQYTERLMGDALFGSFMEAFSAPSPVSLRVNPFRGKVSVPSAWSSVPWCTGGFYLPERPNFTFDPLLHAGLYYVQEASSMFLDRVLRQYVRQPVVMLDLCAAPGGKSTVVRSALPEGSLLVSNEPDARRVQILAENVCKWGHPEVVVTHNYPKDYHRSGLTFDVILTDVPCSGEGMFRKDEGAILEWSMQNVEKCWRLQREIISEIWDCLRPGGLLIYSTCTFNTKENEENIRWICERYDAQVLPVDVEADWQITGSLLPGFEEPVYRFIPGKTQGEGLFMAVLRKPGVASALSVQKGGSSSRQTASRWISGNVELVDTPDGRRAVPWSLSPLYHQARKRLRVIHAGVKLGTTKGKDLIPDQSLALSSWLSPGAFPQVEVSYSDAVRYLRKEAIIMPADTPRGFILITYCHYPLGFVKNIGNRANNLYPSEWRIRSSYLPEKPVRILTV